MVFMMLHIRDGAHSTKVSPLRVSIRVQMCPFVHMVAISPICALKDLINIVQWFGFSKVSLMSL